MPTLRRRGQQSRRINAVAYRLKVALRSGLIFDRRTCSGEFAIKCVKVDPVGRTLPAAGSEPEEWGGGLWPHRPTVA